MTSGAGECYARAAGVSEGSEGECPQTFACGPHRCAMGQYCLDKSDQEDGPWCFACRAPPEACGGIADCACLAGVKNCFGGFTCATIEGSVQVVCN